MKRFAGLAVAASLAVLAVAPSAQAAEADTTECSRIVFIPLCAQTPPSDSTNTCSRLVFIPLCKI